MRKALASDFELKSVTSRDRESRELRIVPISEAAGRKRHRYIILVHGFNVIEWKAEESFDKFRERSRAVSKDFPKELLSLTWPGKEIYPKAVQNARASGKILGAYISNLTNPFGKRPQIVLIGHSLGCRVILEALRWLCSNMSESEHNHIDLFLMAAAVPVQLVEPYERLWKATQFARRSHIYFSKGDWILRVFFPFGQTLTLNSLEGVIPTAVGLRGGPDDEGVWTESKPMRGYGHSSYWTGVEVIQEICGRLKMLDSRHPPGRVLPGRSNRSNWDRRLSHRPL